MKGLNMFAKIINNETKQCNVGLGTDTEFYKSIGMIDMEVEQAYDGSWYVKGYAPVQPIDEYNAEQQEKRSQAYTERTDPLTLRKMRKLALGEWTEEDEANYIAEIQAISEQINEEYPYKE
jgi:hypothetical protein